MTLSQFRKLTKDLGEDVRLVIQGTTPNDMNEQYDVANLLDDPDWRCGDMKSAALLVRTIRCEPRLAKLTVLGDR